MERDLDSHDDTLSFTMRDDPLALIPPGRYQVGFVRAEKRRYFGGMKLYITFVIADLGTYNGVHLFKAFNYSEPLRRGTDLYKTLVLLHGRRVSKKTRLSLKLFQDKLFEVEVRTVSLDRNQHPLAEHQKYSVIDRIITIATGGPT